MPKSFTPATLTGAVRHQWTMQEYERHQRGPWWYILVISLGLALVIYGIWDQNFLFSLIIILAAIILFLQSHLEAPPVQFMITELGVVVGTRFYSYSELEKFYLIYNPPEIKTLYMETQSTWRPTLRVPLLDQNPLALRQTLREFLPEDWEREEEPHADAAARRWKIH